MRFLVMTRKICDLENGGGFARRIGAVWFGFWKEGLLMTGPLLHANRGST